MRLSKPKNFFTFITVFLLVISFFPTKVQAAYFEKSGNLGESISWSFSSKNGKLTINGSGKLVSKNQWQNSYPWSEFIGSVKVLEISNDITEIGAFAFKDAKKLKTLTVSSNVKKVGAYAFDNTKWLSSQKSGAVYIGKCLYAWKGNIPSGSPTFKSGTYYISDYAFANNNFLTTLTVPKSVKYIGNNAFIWCKNLKTVRLKKGVTSLGSSVFSNCTSLSSITLPSSLKEIPEFAFENCTALKQISLPSAVTTVSRYAFYGCENLSSVKLSKSLKTFYAISFMGCSKLKTLTVHEENKHFWADSKGGIYSFNKMKFYYLPLGANIKSYKINSKTTEICEAAFYENKKLTKLTLPKNLKTIGEAVFSGCVNLETINEPKKVSLMDNCAIKDTLWYKNKPSGIIYFSKVLLDYKGVMPKSTTVNVKNGTLSIASNALMGREELTSLTLPSSLTRIGDHAFSLCTSLKSVTVPPSVIYIGQGAFQDCTNFGEITVLNPLCTIDNTHNLVFPANATVFCHKNSSAYNAAKNSNCTVKYLPDINISSLDISVSKKVKLSGSSAKPKIKISYYGKTLKLNRHYTVSYINNTKRGTGQVIIKGSLSSCFSGSVKYNFQIV